MPIWLVVLLVVLVGLAIGAGLVRWSRLRPRVVVVTKSERTFDGVLLHRYPGRLVLGDAHVLERDNRTACDGLVHIDRSNVEWVQVFN